MATIFILWERLFFRSHNFYFLAMTFNLWKQILFCGHDFNFVVKNLKKIWSICPIADIALLWILHMIDYFYQGKFTTFGLLGLLRGKLNKNHSKQNSYQILIIFFIVKIFLKLMLMKQEYRIMGYFTHYIFLIGNRCMNSNSQV